MKKREKDSNSSREFYLKEEREIRYRLENEVEYLSDNKKLLEVKIQELEQRNSELREEITKWKNGTMPNF